MSSPPMMQGVPGMPMPGLHGMQAVPMGMQAVPAGEWPQGGEWQPMPAAADWQQMQPMGMMGPTNPNPNPNPSPNPNPNQV